MCAPTPLVMYGSTWGQATGTIIVIPRTGYRCQHNNDAKPNILQEIPTERTLDATYTLPA